MVSSSSPLNDYCDSDNESEGKWWHQTANGNNLDSRDEDERPPVLQQANVDIFTKLFQTAMMKNSSGQQQQQQQRQITPQKRKTQPVKTPSSRQKQQIDSFMNFLSHASSGSNHDQATLFELITQGNRCNRLTD